MRDLILSPSRFFGPTAIYIVIGIPMDMACDALNTPLWEQWAFAVGLLLFAFRLDALLKALENGRG